MPAPIANLISEELAARLATITSGNGHDVTVAEVLRPAALGDYKPRNNLIALQWMGKSRVTDEDAPGNPPAICWEHTWSVAVWVAPVASENIPIDDLLNVWTDAVHKAVAGLAEWHTMDGNAFFAELGDARRFADEVTNFEGIELEISARVRVSEQAPATAM